MSLSQRVFIKRRKSTPTQVFHIRHGLVASYTCHGLVASYTSSPSGLCTTEIYQYDSNTTAQVDYWPRHNSAQRSTEHNTDNSVKLIMQQQSRGIFCACDTETARTCHDMAIELTQETHHHITEDTRETTSSSSSQSKPWK